MGRGGEEEERYSQAVTSWRLLIGSQRSAYSRLTRTPAAGGAVEGEARATAYYTQAGVMRSGNAVKTAYCYCSV